MSGAIFRNCALAPHVEHDFIRAYSEEKKVAVFLVQPNVIELERPVGSERRRFDLEIKTCNSHVRGQCAAAFYANLESGILYVAANTVLAYLSSIRVPEFSVSDQR